MFVMSRWAVLLWLFFTFTAADFIKNGNENANGTEKPNRTALHSGNEYKESKRFRQHRLDAADEASGRNGDVIAAQQNHSDVALPDRAENAKSPSESVRARHSIKTKHKLKRMWHDLPNESASNNTNPADLNKTSDRTKELIKSSVNDTNNVADANNRQTNNARSTGTRDHILTDERNKAKQINALDEAETSSQRPKVQRILARTENSSANNFNTPSHRKKRRRLILSSTQSVPIDTSRSVSYYNHFQPIEHTPPSEPFGPYSDFGRKIAGAAPRGNVNFVDSLLTEIRNNAKPPLEPKSVPEDDLLQEDMDVTVDRKTIEKNHPPNDRLHVSGTNVAGYYRRPTIKPANYTLALNTTPMCASAYRVRRPYLGNKTLKREVANSTICQNFTLTTTKPEELKIVDRPDIKKFLKARLEQTSTWKSSKNDINQITETPPIDTTPPVTAKILSTAVITSVSVKSNDIDAVAYKPPDSYISIESDDEPEPLPKKSKSDKSFDQTYNSTGVVFSAFNKTKTVQPNARSTLMFYQRNASKNFRTLNRNLQFSKILSPLQSQVRPTVNTSEAQINVNQQPVDTVTEIVTNFSQPSVEYLMNSSPTTELAVPESEPIGVEVTTMNDVSIQNSTVVIVTVNDQQEQNASTSNSDVYNYSTPSSVTYEYTDNLKYHINVQNESSPHINHTEDDNIYAIFAEPAILNYTKFEKSTPTVPTKVNAKPVTAKPSSEELGIGYQIGFHIVTYVLAGLGIIPLVIGIILITKMILSQNKKQIFDGSEYSSEYNRNPLDFHGGVTSSPVATKLPRVPHHMAHWEIEKKAAASISLPNNSKWEFPRDKLRLQTILGQGNFGQVWKAEADDISGHEGLTRLVAVKMVKEISSTREKEDLIRELVIMQHLGSHPNVVTLLGCCTEKEPYMLIMEYVMYGKLLSFLRDHRTRSHYFNFSDNGDTLTSRDLTVFAYCVARGMEYLQNKQIIHRDLAARNILVDHNKLCKIADFGMSRHVGESGQVLEHRQSKGALPIRWMAPESLHYSCYTHKTDVWSFGILMWEIVTLGSMPYATMGARVVMRKVKEGYRLEKPKFCKSQLFNVISKCWCSDPNKRPTFTDLKQDLANLLEDPEHSGNYVDLDSLVEEMNQAVHGSHTEKIVI